MKKRIDILPVFIVLYIFVVLVLFPLTVTGQGNSVPKLINYQGYLTDKDGKALNGDYNITFRLYGEASGTKPWLWQETQETVKADNGQFNVLLGSVTPLSASDFAGDRYLGIQLAGELEMTPRLQLVSVAYSLQTEQANNAKSADLANNATNAAHATNADNANNAKNADQANHAKTADQANNATNAGHTTNADLANYANQAGNATNADQAKNFEPHYDSGWFYVERSKDYTKLHNLGVIPRQVQMFYSESSTGSPVYIVSMFNYSEDNGYQVRLTSSQAKVMTGEARVCLISRNVSKTTGYYRLLLWK